MKLIILVNSYLVLDSDGFAYESSNMNSIIAALTFSGVKEDEVNCALHDMDAKGNTIAHFGMEGTFLFSDGILKQAA